MQQERVATWSTTIVDQDTVFFYSRVAFKQVQKNYPLILFYIFSRLYAFSLMRSEIIRHKFNVG